MPVKPAILPLFKRLSALLASRAPDTPAQLEATLAELAHAHARAGAAARAARAQHERSLLDLLAAGDAAALTRSRNTAAAAEANEAELADALAALTQRLAEVRAQAAADELKQRWSRAIALLEARGAAMAELQARADAYAQALARATELTGEAWAALPVLPAYRPATYGRDLNLRANLYLYGATDGKSGGGASAYVARQRPDLRALDAGAREILLMPMHAAAQAGLAGGAPRIATPADAPPGKSTHPVLHHGAAGGADLPPGGHPHAASNQAAGSAGAPPAAAASTTTAAPHISPDPTRQEAA